MEPPVDPQYSTHMHTIYYAVPRMHTLTNARARIRKDLFSPPPPMLIDGEVVIGSLRYCRSAWCMSYLRNKVFPKELPVVSDYTRAVMPRGFKMASRKLYLLVRRVFPIGLAAIQQQFDGG